MDIKVLGPGCARCHALDKLVRKTIEEMKIDADVEYIQDLEKILDYDIISTPGLVVNGKVKSSGRLPEMHEIKQWINQELSFDRDVNS
jgi:small redox-active disulfide protein 2